MSTELKTRSKAYVMTRVSLVGGKVGVWVGHGGYGGVSRTLSIPDIEEMFFRLEEGSFNGLRRDLMLPDETLPLLQLDLAMFVITKGEGMEIY